MTSVELRRLSIGYRPTGYGPASPVVREASLQIPAGKLLAVLGPSGCGKTTLLRAIAGLLPATSGEILFDSIDVTAIPAERRMAAMVFQKPLLFPHLNVSENVAFGLRMRGMPREDRARCVAEALSHVQLAGFGSRNSRQLSGGQEQRVALARALVIRPRVLLLDEPFSALDESLRAEMREMVRSLQRQLGTTSVFVTHDQQEAAAMADQIAVMMAGRIIQTGPARVFFERPATPEVALFFGWQRWSGRIWCRPEAVQAGGAAHGWAAIEGRVLDVRDLGTHPLSTLEAMSTNEAGLNHIVRAHVQLEQGQRAFLRVPLAQTVEF